jgi:hypothetical protein
LRYKHPSDWEGDKIEMSGEMGYPDDDDEYEDYYGLPRPVRERKDTWLKTVKGHHGNAIATEILDHFLDLPPCKSAAVRPLSGLADRCKRLPRHSPEDRIFDGLYMDDLCCALDFWLNGKRDGIKLSAGLSKKYGEPRLEQLAYRLDKGRLYCDGDEGDGDAAERRRTWCDDPYAF